MESLSVSICKNRPSKLLVDYAGRCKDLEPRSRTDRKYLKVEFTCGVERNNFCSTMPGIVSALWGLASPYKHIRPKKRTYAITGILDGVGPDGSRPLRYEFNKFIDVNHNPYAKYQLPLFLLALSKMQEATRTEKLSWFQICGVSQRLSQTLVLTPYNRHRRHSWRAIFAMGWPGGDRRRR